MVFVGLDWVFLDTSEPALTTSALLIPTSGRTTEGWSPPKAGGGGCGLGLSCIFQL